MLIFRDGKLLRMVYFLVQLRRKPLEEKLVLWDGGDLFGALLLGLFGKNVKGTQ